VFEIFRQVVLVDAGVVEEVCVAEFDDVAGVASSNVLLFADAVMARDAFYFSVAEALSGKVCFDGSGVGGVCKRMSR